MHELAVTQNLLTTVLEEAKAARAKEVTEITLVVGDLSGVVSDCIQFYFDILKKDTIAATASINFKQVTSQLKCRECHAQFHPEDELWVCPNCGSISIEIITGRDCYIESMEVEQ